MRKTIEKSYFMLQSWASHEQVSSLISLQCAINASSWISLSDCILLTSVLSDWRVYTWFLLVWTVNKFLKQLSSLNYLQCWAVRQFLWNPTEAVWKHTKCVLPSLQKCVPKKEWLCGAVSVVSPLARGVKNYAAELKIPLFLMAPLNGLCISL